MGNSDSKKENPRKNIAIIIVMIFLLCFLTYWHLREGRKILTKVRLPKLEMPQFEFSPSKTEGLKEFISRDNKLRLRYPTDWLEIESKAFENFPETEILGGKGKLLFLAQKFKLEKANYAFLMVEELIFNGEKDSEGFIEEMEQGVKEREGQMEILSLEIKDREAVFEARYASKKGVVFHSKEKIILNEKKYLISFFTFEKDFPEFQKEAEEIINSAQLVR